MVYNPMSEYRRQVSYLSHVCLVLSYQKPSIEELFFFWIALLEQGELRIGESRNARNKMLEELGLK